MNRLINSFYAPKLAAGPFYQFISLAIKAAAKADPNNVEFVDERNALLDIEAKLMGKYKEEQAYKQTELLEKLDQERDSLFTGFKLWAEGLSVYPDVKESADAKVINQYLNTLPAGLIRINYNAESTELSKIVATFSEDADLKKAVANSKIAQGFIAAIDAKNKEFIKVYGNRSEEIGEDKKDTETFTNLKPKAYDAYCELVFAIETAYRINKKAKKDVTALQSCIDEINGLIDRFSLLLKEAASKGSKQEEKKA